MTRLDGADNDDSDDESDAAEPRPSRSQQTRTATAINHLGIELTTLTANQLSGLDLPEHILREIEVCQRLKPRSRGRQNRLIGQLLRADDHAAISERFESMKSGSRDELNHERQTERWRDRLVEEGDPAVEALIADYPAADRQRLRTLTRNARQNREARRTNRARRELLRAIRTLRA